MPDEGSSGECRQQYAEFGAALNLQGRPSPMKPAHGFSFSGTVALEVERSIEGLERTVDLGEISTPTTGCTECTCFSADGSCVASLGRLAGRGKAVGSPSSKRINLSSKKLQTYPVRPQMQ